MGGGGGRAAAPSTDLSTRVSSASARSSWHRSCSPSCSLSATGALPRPQLEPVFDGTVAASVASELSTEFPSRVPGTDDAASAARWYSETVSELGLDTEEDVWSADLVDLGEVSLLNIVTVIPGRSDETIILVAHRDNAGADPGERDNASGTAALIELARGFAPQGTLPGPLPNRTFVLVSTDAGAYGGAGAVRFARTSVFAQEALAVIVLDDVGADGRPRIALAGDGSSSPARTLVRTASARVSEETGQAPAIPSVLTQLVDLGMPFAAAEHGPFVAEGIAAISLTTRDQADDRASSAGLPGALSERRLGQLGRATEALVASIDASVGAAFRTPDSVFLEERTASGWTVRLAFVVAMVPLRSAFWISLRGAGAEPCRFDRRCGLCEPACSSGSGPACSSGLERLPASCPPELRFRYPRTRRSSAIRTLPGSPCWPLRSSSAGCSFAVRSFPRRRLRP